MVSRNLDYCSRKVTHFLKYPTVTVKVIPSSLKFNFIYICRENKTFNYTLIALKIRSAHQFGANQKEGNKTNSLQAVKQSSFERPKTHLRRSRRIQNGHVKLRVKLLHRITGRLHNPPLSRVMPAQLI